MAVGSDDGLEIMRDAAPGWIRAVLASLVLLGFGSVSAADLKIGFVHAQTVMEQSPQADAAREKLRKEFEPREREIIELQERLLVLEEALERGGATMEDREREQLERDILTTRRTIKRAQTDFREDFNLRRTQELARIHEDIQEAIVAIAENEGFDLIVGDGVIFASEKVNITSLILDRLRTYFKQEAKP
jgi:outer membrane protein